MIIKFDFDAVNDYVVFIRRYCLAMQERQNAVETAYFRLGEVWNDEVYSKTGDGLGMVARGLGSVYSAMRDALGDIVKDFNRMCDYNDTNAYISGVALDDFVARVKGGSNSMNNKVVETDPQALKDFLHKLYDYIDDTNASLKEISNRHSEMSAFWRGEGYDKFSSVLSGSCNDIRRQLTELDAQGVFVEKKYHIIVDD